MKTLYLHIGMPKTGTTYLQKFFTENNALLEKQGFCYPKFGYKFRGIGSYRNAHFLICRITEGDTRDLEREREIGQDCFSKLFEIFEGCDNVILSDEKLWNSADLIRGEDFYKKLRERLSSRGIALKIIVYLRRQDLFVQSFYAQNVKQGYRHSFKSFLKGKVVSAAKLDYCENLDRIAQGVGKENIIVRPYEKEQFGGEKGTIVTDFLSAVGMKYDDGFVEMSHNSNRSLTGIYLELKRRLNKNEIFTNKKNYTSNLLINAMVENGDDRQFDSADLFTAESYKKFMGRYTPGNEKIAREYLGRADGRLFYQPETDTFKAPDYKTDDLIRVMGEILQAQRQKQLDEIELNRLLEEENKTLRSTVDWMSASFPKKVIRKLRRIFGISKPKEKNT